MDNMLYVPVYSRIDGRESIWGNPDNGKTIFENRSDWWTFSEMAVLGDGYGEQTMEEANGKFRTDMTYRIFYGSGITTPPRRVY